jgi:CHAT domain-containing protein/Tfp pilus assembly protein PilF
MGFGNSRIILICLSFLLFINGQTYAQEKTDTSDFLYNQLDYFLRNPSSSGLLRLSKIVASKENQLPTKSDQLAWVIVNCNIGYYHNQFGNMPAAILYYERAWKTFYDKGITDYDIIENGLQPLGNLYIKIGDLKKAENTIKNYLYLAEQSQNIPKIVSGITNLSIAYNNQGNYQKAVEILHKGLELDPKNANILTNLATNYWDLGELMTAEKMAKKVIFLDPDQINAYQILAAISLEKEDINEAQDYILQSKSRLLKDPSTSARSLAKWQLAYIDLCLSKSEYSEAEKYLREIYDLLLPAYGGEHLPLANILIADKIFLKALDVHASVFQKTERPLEALKAYNLAFAVNEKLNLLYPLQETRIIQHNQNRDRTEAYITLAFSLYKNTKNRKFIEQAFEQTEHAKAPVVNEALISKKILSQYESDPLVVQKEQLSSELSLYDTYIVKEKQRGNEAKIEQIQKWAAQYDAKSIELKEILKKLQGKYPDLLVQNEVLSIPQLQGKLGNDNTVLIEYFYGKKSVYQFVIDSDSLRIIEITDLERFDDEVRGFISFFDSPSNITNDIKQFTESAFRTLNRLMIPTTDKRLLIIPDGLLCFIPFEALITQKTNVLNFQKMPFLIKSNEVSYDISASKYARSGLSENKKRTVLGVFPVFEKTDLELPFSLIESAFVQESFDGDFLEKEQATYGNFIDKVKDHSILHLSTHAEAGSFNRPASIKFWDQDILVNQLYGLNLSADLVVLSACETGVGKLAKGEGPLSIGRGFQYAGVENVLFSLWRVNDKTTSVLMNNFYHHLKQSNSKVAAVHQAKLEYLEAKDISNAQKSPYHWAAFVYYGEIQKSTSQCAIWVWFIIGGVVLFFLATLILRRFIMIYKKNGSL